METKKEENLKKYTQITQQLKKSRKKTQEEIKELTDLEILSKVLRQKQII